MRAAISSPSPIRAPRCEKIAEREAASTTSSSAFPASAAAIRCCRNSAWCRSRRSASTCARFSTGAHHGADLRRGSAAAGESRRRARPAIGDAARPGATRSRSSRRPRSRSFGAWAEQLLAESTGKHGKGLIPVDGEPLGDPWSMTRSAVHLFARLRRSRCRRRTPRSMRCERPDTRSCASTLARRHTCSPRSSSAGRSRPRSPVRSSASIRSTSRTSRRARSRRAS